MSERDAVGEVNIGRASIAQDPRPDQLPIGGEGLDHDLVVGAGSNLGRIATQPLA